MDNIIQRLKEVSSIDLKRKIHIWELQYLNKDYSILNLEYYLDMSFKKFSLEFNSLANKFDISIKIMKNPQDKSQFTLIENHDMLYIESQVESTDALREDEYIKTMGKEKKEIKFFISYSHKDKENVELLISQLEKKISVLPIIFILWKDKNNLISGENFKGNIQQAIEECDFGLLMVSENFESKFILEHELPNFLEIRSSDIPKIKPSIPLFLNSKASTLENLNHINSEMTIFDYENRGFIESTNREEFIDALINEIFLKYNIENQKRRDVIVELLNSEELKDLDNEFINTIGGENIDVVKEVKEWSNIKVKDTEEKIELLKNELIIHENRVNYENKYLKNLNNILKVINSKKYKKKYLDISKLKILNEIILKYKNQKINFNKIFELIKELDNATTIEKDKYLKEIEKISKIQFFLNKEEIFLDAINLIEEKGIYNINEMSQIQLEEIRDFELKIPFKERIQIEERFYFFERFIRILAEEKNYQEKKKSLSRLKTYKKIYKKEKLIYFEKFKLINTKKNRSRFFALLGDSGMGKTWSCMKIVSELKDEKNILKPIYLDLRKFALSEAINRDFKWEEIIKIVVEGSLHTIKKEMSVNIIFDIIKQGEAFVIFDGLDEVTVHLKDVNKANAFIKELREIVLINKSNKILFSCRTHYFRTIEEQFSMLSGNDRDSIQKHDFMSLELLPFSWSQIEEYCEKKSIEFNPFKEILMSIHNLEEMSQRPYSLKLLSLLEAKLRKKIASNEVINSADIYLYLIEMSLNRDSGKHSLSEVHKPFIMRDLSAYMWKNNLREIEYPKLDEWFSKWMYNHPYIAEEYKHDSREKLKADLRGATFIVRPNSNVFRFYHTSLQEFFLAWYLFDALEKNEIDKFDIKIPSMETLEFFVMLWKNSKFKEQLKLNFEPINSKYNIALDIKLVMNKLELDIDFDTPLDFEGDYDEEY